MSEVKILSKCEYLVGYLNEDVQPLIDMVLANYYEGRNMSSNEHSIRREDIRINFTPQLQSIVKKLIAEWKQAFGQDIELCWQNQPGFDPNEAYWAVVHEHNQSTNLHSHESSDNYESGAHISSAYYIQIPKNSGDFIFQHQPTPYETIQEKIVPEVNKFLMFSSTIPHYVTRNLSHELRIVITMNFRIVKN